MIFDKNNQRIKELKKELLKETDQEKIDRLRKRISKYESKGAVYYIKFTDPSGKPIVEKVPLEYRGKRGAEKYEATKIGAVETGLYSPKSARTVRLNEICDYYLCGKMKGKSSYSSAKTLCAAISEHLGHLSLDQLVKQPEILNSHFNAFPEIEWADKYIWNYKITLRAAIQFWISTQELFLYNPVDRVNFVKKIEIVEYVPTDQDFEKVIMITYTIGLPDQIRFMLIAVYETGLRINEVLHWKIEEMDLNEPVFDESGTPTFMPYFTTNISKQGRVVRKRIPMSKKLWEMLKILVGDRKTGYAFTRQTPPYRDLRWLRCNHCDHRLYDQGNRNRTVKQLRIGDYCPICKIGMLEIRHLNQEAGVPYTRPFHDYRKSVKYKNKILRKLPKEITKEYQGHATDSMDEYYLHLQTSDLYSVVRDTW